MEQVIIVKQITQRVSDGRCVTNVNVTDVDELNDELRKGWKVKNITSISEDPIEVMVVLEKDD